MPRSWRAGEPSAGWLGSLDAPPEGWNGTPPREIEVSTEGGVRGVAVWLEPVGLSADLNARRRIPEVPRTIRMEGSCFWPMTTVAPAGGHFRFVNADARLHHVTFLSEDSLPDLTVGPGESVEIIVGAPGLIRLTCNDHAFMRADLIVTPTSFAAVTDAEGHFEIDGVPAGEYDVRFAHHRIEGIQEAPRVKVGEGSRVSADLRARRD